MASKPASRQQLENQVMEKAASDPHFRQSLMADPRGTLQRELGVELPDTMEFAVVEESPSQVFLVLPPQSGSGQKLSEGDLERVAGGDPTIPWPTGSC